MTAARNLFKMVHDADVAELADAPDLGSGGDPVQVRPLSSAPNENPLLSMEYALNSGFLFFDDL